MRDGRISSAWADGSQSYRAPLHTPIGPRTIIRTFSTGPIEPMNVRTPSFRGPEAGISTTWPRQSLRQKSVRTWL